MTAQPDTLPSLTFTLAPSPAFDLNAVAFTLPEFVAIYIPGTANVDQVIDTSAHVTACQAFLASLFGGCTALPAQGSWVREDNGQLVTEDITICKANCTREKYTEHLETVYKYSLQLCKDLRQEAVSLETSRNGLTLVS